MSMKLTQRRFWTVTFALVLYGCGGPLETPPGDNTLAAVKQRLSPSSAVHEPKVHVGEAHGDPAYGWIDVSIKVDDAQIREEHPWFDGLESVYVDVPDVGRHWLRYYRTTDGLDFYYATIGYRSEEARATRYGDFVFGVVTNVGWFHDVARGERMPFRFSPYD